MYGQHKFGSTRVFVEGNNKIRAYPMYDDDNRITCVIITFSDGNVNTIGEFAGRITREWQGRSKDEWQSGSLT